MPKQLIFFGTACLLAALGCDRGEPDLLTKLNLNRAVTARPIVDNAILLCNAILKEVVPFRFYATWEALQASANRVPVHLVDSLNLGMREIVFIPDKECAIVINECALESYFTERHVKSEEDKATFLCIMLLHEMGHIVQGDAGSYVGTEPLSLELLNQEITPRKNRELAADRFAARQIKQGFVPGERIERFSAAMRAATLLPVMSFNATSNRLLQHFGDRSSRPYLDRGYSHPHFELRLLIILHEINPDDSSRRLIEDFFKQRERPTHLKFFEAS